MKKIHEIRMKNSYFYISLIALIVIMGITWFFESGFAEVMFFMDYDAPDLIGQSKEEVKRMLLDQILVWEGYIDSAMRYIVYIFPVFAVIPTIPFLLEQNSYFVFGAARFDNYNKNLGKAILTYTLQGGVCITLGLLIYFTIGNLVMVPALDDISGFTSVLPKGFYAEHSYLFFVFMSVTIYFFIGLVFAGMACGVALFTTKEYYVLIIPILVYIGLGYLGSGFGIHLFQIPVAVISYNTKYTTFECFIPLIPPAIIDIILISVGIARRKKEIVC